MGGLKELFGVKCIYKSSGENCPYGQELLVESDA